MDDQSVFEREKETARNAMELLYSGEVPDGQWPVHFEQLLKEYSKLLRQSEKLVRIGDIMQNRLNELNSQLVRQRKVAEEANKAKSQFLAMMSHDIRNPMAAVVVMTDLLMQTELSTEQLEYLSDIKTASNSLVSLLDELLDLSRIEAGKLDLACADFGIWDCIGDALRTAAIAAHAKPIEMCSFIDRHVPFRGIGDCGRLGQILMNLLSNAVKFTERGEILIRTEVQQGGLDKVTLHFSVSDSGIGIPADRLDSVFEEFEQADTQIQGRYGGSGLGLAICSRLVKGMGGKIWVESTLGKGSTFHVTVPMIVAPEWTGSSAHERFARLEGLRVLVVSHTPIRRSILEEFLRTWDVQSVAVGTGEEAIEEARQARAQGRPFEVFVLDGSMPEMEDLGLVRQLLRVPEIRVTRIVVLTALDSLSQSAAASRLGIVHRLPKPPRLLDLLTTLVRALDQTTEPEPPSVPEDHEGEDRHGHGASKLNILVAEDNPINRVLALRMLEKMGQEVLAVEDGDAVLRALEKNDFDLILMDVEMPRKNGMETARAIREREMGTGKHVQIIATTAHVMDEDRQRFLEAGMDACIAKPIDWRQLMEILKGIG
jgi:two-component system, sensor histidine kinase and response regulator